VSQAGLVNIAGGGGGGTPIMTLTGNNPVAVPPTANNVFTVGTGSITIQGNAGTSTLTTELTGLGNHSVLVGAGTPTITSLAVGTNGQVLLGSTGANPVFNNLTSADGSITFTTGPGTLNLQVASGADVGKTITGNTGGALSPILGNWNIFGTGSIITNGVGNTLTTELTGLTNHAVQVGAGTATLTQVGPSATTGQVLQNNAGADPSYSTATYPSTTTINQILYSSSNNVVAGLTTANDGVLTTGTTGIPVITALSSNGQLIIGSGSGAPIAATLTAGTGITVTNAANSITIAATGGSFAWVDVTTATQTLSVQTGYVTDHSGGVVYTLPATASIGDQIRIMGKQTSWSIAQNANQQIVVSSASSTVGTGGSVASTNLGDCIWLVCITAGASTLWRAESFVGNLTVT
jgi:trimeric autotransporter adhesin